MRLDDPILTHTPKLENTGMLPGIRQLLPPEDYPTAFHQTPWGIRRNTRKSCSPTVIVVIIAK